MLFLTFLGTFVCWNQYENSAGLRQGTNSSGDSRTRAELHTSTVHLLGMMKMAMR